MDILKDKLKHLPENPGVYVMLDKDGQIIYVGKAKNLKNRVRQYFQASVKTDKVMAMVSNIADFYYIIAPTEIDALSLENNLIKKHKPRYNILLKDDKTYPYLKIDLKENFPTFKITRKIKKDGAKYFGPFMGGVSVRDVLEIINLAFGIRPCDKKLNPEKPIKECLNYHIKKCMAPCAGCVDKNTYLDAVNKAIDFLSGDTYQTENLLKEKMLSASEREEFELALKYRDNLNSLEKIKSKRITSLNKFLNADVLGYCANGIYSAVSLLIVRNGRMLGAKTFSFSCLNNSDSETLREFVLQYYKVGTEIPDEIICQTEIADSQVLADYFKKNFSKSVSILQVKQGVRKQLCDMAEEVKDFPSRVDVDANDFFAPDSMIQAICDYCERTGQPVPKTPGEVSTVVYQSLAECYGRTVKALESITGKTYEAINIVGGGSNAAYLNQLTANATGKTVYAGPGEATALGNIVAQMLTAGEYDSLAAARKAIFDSFAVKTFLPQ